MRDNSAKVTNRDHDTSSRIAYVYPLGNTTKAQLNVPILVLKCILDEIKSVLMPKHGVDQRRANYRSVLDDDG